MPINLCYPQIWSTTNRNLLCAALPRMLFASVFVPLPSSPPSSSACLSSGAASRKRIAAFQASSSLGMSYESRSDGPTRRLRLRLRSFDRPRVLPAEEAPPAPYCRTCTRVWYSGEKRGESESSSHVTTDAAGRAGADQGGNGLGERRREVGRADEVLHVPPTTWLERMGRRGRDDGRDVEVCASRGSTSSRSSSTAPAASASSAAATDSAICRRPSSVSSRGIRRSRTTFSPLSRPARDQLLTLAPPSDLPERFISEGLILLVFRPRLGLPSPSTLVVREMRMLGTSRRSSRPRRSPDEARRCAHESCGAVEDRRMRGGDGIVADRAGSIVR